MLAQEVNLQIGQIVVACVCDPFEELQTFGIVQQYIWQSLLIVRLREADKMIFDTDEARGSKIRTR